MKIVGDDDEQYREKRGIFTGEFEYFDNSERKANIDFPFIRYKWREKIMIDVSISQ